MPRKMTAKEVSDKLNDDTLDLGLCDLEEVPVKEIFTIKRYLTVDLSSNLLVTLPKNFAILTQIVKLDLSNNLLESLPENFGELKMLKHLDLYHNKISRLPLSLGDLKNLKWLDLKDNPLTPAVASIAGPCINSNECYACAKNIVTYLSKVKITIEEEKERRLKAKQEIEKTVANNKKEAKKKKNAQNKNNVEKEKATPILKIEPSEQSNMQKPPKVDKTNQHSKKKKRSNGGAFNLVCRVFTSLIIWSVFFIFLTAVVIAILPLYDKQQSEEVFRYIEIQAGVPIKHYRQEGIKLLEVSIEKAKLWSNQAREVAEKTYQEYFPEDVATKKKSES